MLNHEQELRFVTARRSAIARDFVRLNPEQRKAALATEGPLLLLAGAGLVIAIEFALDGKIQLPGVTNTMLYAVDFLAATAMMLSVVIGDGRVKEAQ